MNEGLIPGLDRGERPPPPFPPPFPMVAFIGDSIVNNMGAKTSVGTWSGAGAAWSQWAQLYAGGRFLVGAQIGYPGATSSVVRQYVLPQLLADVRAPMSVKPGYCVVLAGTNDGTIFADTRAALTGIYDTLTAEGIIPILCTLTPRVSIGVGHQRINSWIRWYGATNGLHVIDFAAASTLNDPSSGAWLSGLTGDGLHPNSAGAKAMGQVMATAFAGWDMLNWVPPFSQINADPNNLISTTNALLVTDTNSDGTPDGWTASLGTGGTSALASAAAPGLGNTMTVTRGTATCIQASPGLTWATGALLAMAVRLEVTVAGTSPDAMYAFLYGGFPYAWSTSLDVPAGSVMCALVRPPSGSTLAGRVMISGGDGTAVKVTQPSAISLTALGIA